MQLLARLNATSLFLQELVNCPRQVGAILPSSKKLAVAMARWLPADSDAYALELGPGHRLRYRGAFRTRPARGPAYCH